MTENKEANNEISAIKKYWNDKKESFVMFHQGWTDIILCIGLIFYNLDNYSNVVLLMREDSKDMIDFIFRNIININIIYINKKLLDTDYKYKVIAEYKNKNFDINLYGGSLNKNINHIPKDIANKYHFYKSYSIDENLSIQNFKIERNYQLEDNKYKYLINKIGDKYVIIFDDKDRNLSIDKSKIINKNLPTFNLCNSSKICFDLIKIIENAEEIHILSTFWSLIIYQLQKKYNLFNKNNIYFHDSRRSGYYSSLYENNNWIIV
tara:strand:- start:2743 stop:3534 length:792 start_codon:yes stop_codon:yes gene_type:complete